MSVLLRPEEGSKIISHREKKTAQKQGADNGKLLLGKEQMAQCG